MNAQLIEDILSGLSVNSRGSIRGKGAAINKIQAEHYKCIEKILMDIRVTIAMEKKSLGDKATLLSNVEKFVEQKYFSI
jgi:hypothetical protein